MKPTESPPDPFHYARDHDAPTGWCVVGPRGFKVAVGDKLLALTVAKLLSGRTAEAAELAGDIVLAVMRKD